MNSTWYFNVSRIILDNSRVWKGTFTEPSFATFHTACTSSTESEDIKVLAVLHLHREPAMWKGRN
jgi:hypothetical protein